MKTVRSSSLAIALLGLLQAVSYGQVIGNMSASEEGSIVFRTLTWPLSFNDHGGIYVDFSDSQTIDPTPNPWNRQNWGNHTIVEMTGITGTTANLSCTGGVNTFLAVSSTQGITNKTLAAFAAGSPTYWGSYDSVGGFSGTGSQKGTRGGILTTATQLRTRVPAIPYAVGVGDCLLDVFEKYMDASGSGSTVQLSEISYMRSDAFVEYAYADNLYPILPQSIKTRLYMSQIDDEAIYYTPQYQRKQLVSLRGNAPTITLIDGISGAPITTGATSSTTINILVEDATSGPGRLEMIRTSDGAFFVANIAPNTTSYLYTSSDIGTLGSLSDGFYSLTAYDQAGNLAYGKFKIDSAAPSNTIEEPDGSPHSETIKSTNCVSVSASRPTSGIQQWTGTGPGGFNASATYSCPSTENPSKFGPFCLTTAGDYVWTSVSCAGVPKGTTVTVQSAPYGMVMSLDGSTSTLAALTENQVKTGTMTIEACLSLGGNCLSCTTLNKYAEVELEPGNSQFCPGFLASPSCCTRISNLAPGSRGFTVTNTTTSPIGPYQMGVAVTINKGGPDQTGVSLSINNYTGGSVGSVSIPDIGRRYPIEETIDGVTITSDPQSLGPSITPKTCSNGPVYLYKRIYPSIGCFSITGSQIVYATTASVTVSYEDTPGGVVTDTTTLAFYTYDGADWSTAAVTSQSVTKSTTTGIVFMRGEYLRTGEFGAFFNASDSSVPITTFAFQGSTFSFDSTVYASTDSYAILTATDPVVNGFNMRVASTMYRLDATTSTMPYSVYNSSIPLSLGTHVFEYYSYDWVGNTETVKTATFTATAGAGFRNTNDHQVMGSLLAGFLGSGAQAEVVSGAENAYTLIVSSVNRTAMVSASNIGSVAVGPQTPEGRLDLGQGSVALGLRSGNATSTGTALQMTFGFNGDYSMRHALRTRHSTATDGNRMDFLLWSPAAGSTTTVASVNVLSVQGISTANDGSFHVMPFGEPDAEVEVSNGSTLGGGTLQCQSILTPSSRRFKSDVRYLDSRQEDAALDGIAAMRHARFRYKARDGSPQPLNVGLIYEEAPETIRAAEKTLSTVERVADLEMALKAALRQLEALEKRHAEFKSRRRTP